MSKTLTISYNLNPPPNAVTPESHPASNAHRFTVPTSKSQEEFYKALRDVVIQAKTQIGADLTIWRDAVGQLESAKETKRVQMEDDGEDEDEEEGEEV